jgi:flagellar biosynthesis/type III secretory pathway protein FliH
MTNNKQQTAVEWYIIKRDEIEMKIRLMLICANQYEQELTKADEQAKEMEIAGKEMSYSDGYAQGYQRALDYISMSIENAKALISTEII